MLYQLGYRPMSPKNCEDYIKDRPCEASGF